jgi:uncharacterized membrane protein (UPF0127 family)
MASRIHMIARLSLALLVLVVIIGPLAWCSMRRPADGLETVIIDDRPFHLELALTPEERDRGLMNRASIPEDGGMLFIFPDTAMRSFWMLNCLVDIDIIFLDGNGRITAMHHMRALEPKREDETELEYQRRVGRWRYGSRFPAQFAIELRGGTIRELDLEIDDRIELDLARLKAMARSVDDQ